MLASFLRQRKLPEHLRKSDDEIANYRKMRYTAATLRQRLQHVQEQERLGRVDAQYSKRGDNST
jgi:hypothetical protein